MVKKAILAMESIRMLKNIIIEFIKIIITAILFIAYPVWVIYKALCRYIINLIAGDVWDTLYNYTNSFFVKEI